MQNRGGSFCCQQCPCFAAWSWPMKYWVRLWAFDLSLWSGMTCAMMTWLLKETVLQWSERDEPHSCQLNLHYLFSEIVFTAGMTDTWFINWPKKKAFHLLQAVLALTQGLRCVTGLRELTLTIESCCKEVKGFNLFTPVEWAVKHMTNLESLELVDQDNIFTLKR